MATVIRIKRRHDEEPTDNIIVKAKRSRLEAEEDEAGAGALCEDFLDTFMTRVGTVDSKEDDIQPHVIKVMKEYKKGWELREQYKKLGSSRKHRNAKEQIKENSSKKRYKIIAACRRMKDDDTKRNKEKEKEKMPDQATKSQEDRPGNKKEAELAGDSSLSSDQFKLYDATLPDINLKDEVITCNGEPMESVKYVYDIYYTPQSVDWIENICEIEKHPLQLYTGSDSEDSELEDDDDENDENNWRNDYPDESDDSHYSDEMEYLNAQIRKVNTKYYRSDESYDIDDYEEEFDEEGNLIDCGYPYGGSRIRKQIADLSSSEESDQE